MWAFITATEKSLARHTPSVPGRVWLFWKRTSKKGKADIPIDEFVEDVVLVMVDEVHKAKADVLQGST